MTAPDLQLEVLTEQHFASALGTLVLPVARGPMLAANVESTGRAFAICRGGSPLGYCVFTADGEMLMQILSSAQRQGVGRRAIELLVGRGQAVLSKLVAKARPMTGGERLARHAGLAEVRRQPLQGTTSSEIQFETVPRTLFHYIAVDKLHLVLGPRRLVNRLVSESEDDEEMDVAAAVFEDVESEKTTVPSGFATQAHRDMWNQVRAAATYDRGVVGITCFSEHSDAEALWKYPDPQTPSVALEIETGGILQSARALDVRAEYVKCEARPAEQRLAVEALLDVVATPPSGFDAARTLEYALRTAAEFAQRFVYEDFEDEGEWRLVVSSAARDSAGIAFIEDVRVRSVRLQAEFTATHLHKVAEILTAAGYRTYGIEGALLRVARD